MKTSKELVEAFNSLRLQYLGEKVSGEELSRQLKAAGFNAETIALFKRNKEIFSSERKFGKPKMFSFMQKPLYIGQLTAILQQAKELKASYNRNWKKPEEKKYSFTEEEAVEFLKSQGYRLQKEVGLDIETLKKENPKLFEKYLILKTV